MKAQVILMGLVATPFTLAGELSLAPAPLSVSSNAEPNVMVVMDTSASMNTVVFAKDFYLKDRSNQPSWKYGTESWQELSNSDSVYYIKSLRQGRCARHFYEFTLSQRPYTRKCLRLPAPEGDDTRYDGMYLNYLLNTYAHNTNLTNTHIRNPIPQESRMQSARDAATTLVNTVNGMRIGLASFHFDQGGKIDAECGAPKATLRQKIGKLSADNWTPLSETLYEVTRYFRGLNGFYNNTRYTSPIQYRCQKNFTVVITDGLPTQDEYFPGSHGDPHFRSSQTLPDWDGQSPAMSRYDVPYSIPPYADGHFDSNSTTAYSLYTDDVAKFAWDIDFITGSTDLDGKSFDDPEFKQQNMHTYAIGFGQNNQHLVDIAEYGHGDFYTATDVTGLNAVLKATFNDIISKSSSASAAAASTGTVRAGSNVYFASFNSGNWSGALRSYEINSDEESRDFGHLKWNNSRSDGAQWNAAEELPEWNSRKIFTNKGQTGYRFRWDNFTSAEKRAYFNDEQAMLEYLRGRNQSDSIINVDKYRKRSVNLGDIVNSSPVYIAKPHMGYPENLESDNYEAFVAKHRNRQPMIYVGANDGMMHGFDATSGVEKMAFIPSAVLNNLKQLADPDYSHRYFVDGSPTVVDAFVRGKWRTILLGGLNGGGQSIYALDVTDPSKFSETEANAQKLFMWEFEHPDLGYSFSPPLVVKLSNNKWYVAFGSGYNSTEKDGSSSTDGDGCVFLVDIDTGKLAFKLSTKEGVAEDPTLQARPNGIPEINPVDYNGDSITDAIYTGDLFGNVWKFDLSGSLYSISRHKLFEACADSACSQNSVQPITTAVLVGRAPKSKGGAMVYVGTGKYLESTDNNGASGGIQSVYGFYDDGKNHTYRRDDLQKQEITHELDQEYTDDKGTDSTSDDEIVTQTLRITSSNAISPTKKGWYMDLLSVGTQKGERIVANMTLRRGRLMFLTSVPDQNTCRPEGDVWFFDFNAYTGSPLGYSPFDNNNDLKFTTSDKVTVGGQSRVASASKIGGGSASELRAIVGKKGTLIYNGDRATGRLYTNSGPGLGRQRWEQKFR